MYERQKGKEASKVHCTADVSEFERDAKTNTQSDF